MKKYCYESYENLTVDERNAQLIYLRYKCNLTPTQIKKYINDLSLKTIRSYIYKYVDLIEESEEMFSDSFEAPVNYTCDNYPTENIKDNYYAYIIELFNENGEFEYLKVGKTKQLEVRMKKHARDYGHVVIKKLYDCKTEGCAYDMENILRNLYKEKYPYSYVRNDRFSYVEFDEEDLLDNEELEIAINNILKSA